MLTLDLPLQIFYYIPLLFLISAVFICHRERKREGEKKEEKKPRVLLSQTPDLYMIKFCFLFKVFVNPFPSPSSLPYS